MTEIPMIMSRRAHFVNVNDNSLDTFFVFDMNKLQVCIPHCSTRNSQYKKINFHIFTYNVKYHHCIIYWCSHFYFQIRHALHTHTQMEGPKSMIIMISNWKILLPCFFLESNTENQIEPNRIEAQRIEIKINCNLSIAVFNTMENKLKKIECQYICFDGPLVQYSNSVRSMNRNINELNNWWRKRNMI